MLSPNRSRKRNPVRLHRRRCGGLCGIWLRARSRASHSALCLCVEFESTALPLHEIGDAGDDGFRVVEMGEVGDAEQQAAFGVRH